MRWLWGLLAVLFVLDALRLRGRLAAFKMVAAEAEEPASREYRIIVAPGVVVDDVTARAAVAFAQTQGLAVLDLVPGDLPSLSAMGLARAIDPARYRADRFGRGRTAGHALLVTDDVLARSGTTDVTPSDPVDFVRQAAKLKPYACTTMDLAIAPRLRAVEEDLTRRLAVLREGLGSGEPLRVLVVQPLLLVVLAPAILYVPLWGLLALAAYHAQPLIALRGQGIRPPDLLATVLFRSPVELWTWLRTVFGRWHPPPKPDPVELRRPEYERLALGGLDRFFEPRRETCPLCGSSDLSLQVHMPDLLQHKPGRFQLERCGSCGHLFQNPRLTIEGLDYYYKDFYDGLSPELIGWLFGVDANRHLACARMVEGRMEPTRWLDVGTGGGHFCCAARQVWPKTIFDGLDFSESISEAVRRRWVDTGYRGLFPDLTPKLAGTYDVVSMFHYLEHTRDPQAELAAARRVLTDAGYLIIEMPDPECCMGRLLGRFWVPWLQPQHQHLLSVANLDKLLRRHGFEPVVWHRSEAHQRGAGIGLAVCLFLGDLAPFPNLPWRPPPSRLQRVRFVLVWALGVPLALLGLTVDLALQPVLRRPGLANTYRVLAKRNSGDESLWRA